MEGTTICTSASGEDDKCTTPLSTKGMEKGILLNKRVAKKFRVSSSNKSHKDGKVNKIFFGTVGNLISGKEDSWRILYDDGDIDIFSHSSVLDAIKYYDMNKDYDTVSRKTELNGEKGGKNTATKITRSTVGNVRGKASTPKRKKTNAKVQRKEAVPVWTGPPDEEIDGGWPQGVSNTFVVILYLRSSRCYFVPASVAKVEWILIKKFPLYQMIISASLSHQLFASICCITHSCPYAGKCIIYLKRSG